VIDVTLSTQADLVKTVVIHILIEGGYALERKHDENLMTGHGEISNSRNWLHYRQFGAGSSRVDGM
jgi:hypothetical protein